MYQRRMCACTTHIYLRYNLFNCMYEAYARGRIPRKLFALYRLRQVPTVQVHMHWQYNCLCTIYAKLAHTDDYYYIFRFWDLHFALWYAAVDVMPVYVVHCTLWLAAVFKLASVIIRYDCPVGCDRCIQYIPTGSFWCQYCNLACRWTINPYCIASAHKRI